MSAYDALIFGFCLGFVACFPFAIALHFVARLLYKRGDYYEDFP